MLGHWKKALALGSMLGGLCLSACANTTVPGTPASGSGGPHAGPSTVIAQTDLAIPPGGYQDIVPRPAIRIALLLPTRSDALRPASDAVRAGFQAAYEREQDGMAINVIETGDTQQDVLTGYQQASAENDIVVGPLSRTGVTAVASSGAVIRPTIALTAPEQQEGTTTGLPSQMLVIALSIEDEARQVANWASSEHPASKAIILFTKAAWQRRAANAFGMQWQQRGAQADTIELTSNDGFLNGRELLQLKKQLETDPAIVFLALDARQARQVRAILGKETMSYGTSQINPFILSAPTLTDPLNPADTTIDMDGMRLVDIPWQLQVDHPAVMAYPRPVVPVDQQRSADLERLYALGIDAYRIARELAAQHNRFDIDGVTGKLTVHIDAANARFERTAQRAIYRNGRAVPLNGVR